MVSHNTDIFENNYQTQRVREVKHFSARMERNSDRAEAEELTAYDDEQQREEEEEWKGFEDSCVVFPKRKKGVNCDSEVEQTHRLDLLTKLRSGKCLYVPLHTEHPLADSGSRSLLLENGCQPIRLASVEQAVLAHGIDDHFLINTVWVELGVDKDPVVTILHLEVLRTAPELTDAAAGLHGAPAHDSVGLRPQHQRLRHHDGTVTVAENDFRHYLV